MTRTFRLFTLAGIALATLLTFHGATAAIVQDQGQLFGTTGDVTIEGGETVSQSITPGITGQLVAIEIQIAEFPDDDPFFTFTVRAGGNPAMGGILFSETLEIADDEGEIEFEWDVSSAGLFFSAGEQFLFELSTDSFSYVIAGDDGGYPDGELFRDGVPDLENSDMAFITYVDAVPLPPAIIFLGSGLVALMFRRKT